MPAIRDFTRTAFAAACKRQGFRVFAGAWLQDLTATDSHISYGMVYTRDGKQCRRYSLARAIRLRNADQLKAK